MTNRNYVRNNKRYALLAEIEWAGEAWQFDLTGIFLDNDTEDLYIAHDSGCSCPIPWEDTVVGDLKLISRVQEWDDLASDRLDDRLDTRKYWVHPEDFDAAHATVVEETAIIRKIISDHLRARKAVKTEYGDLA